jgi:hypothetical protein
MNPLSNLNGKFAANTMQCTTAIFFGSLDSHEYTLSQKILISWRGGTWLSSKGYDSTWP